MTYQNRFARITNFGKLADRFLTCQVNQPMSDELKAMGSLYFLIEITNPWLSAAQVGQTIVNTLVRYYYRGQESSNIINFENAVKKVNEGLAQITQNGETDWIGNLNAILILNIGDELHFTQTGDITAFLLRGNNINTLNTGKEGQQETHPLKTFSNIASGNVEANDKIVLSNNQIIKFIPQDKFESLTKKHSPRYSLFEIAKILKKQKVKTVNAIILEILDSEAAANLPLEDIPETIYLDQPLESYAVTFNKYLNNFVKPSLVWLGKSASKLAISIKNFTQKHITPLISRFFKSAKKKTIEASTKTTGKFSDILSKNGNENKKPATALPKISHYKESKIIKSAKNIFQWFKIHPKYLYGICAILFILVVISLISNRTDKKSTSETQAPNTVAIDGLLSDANKSLILNDTTTAVTQAMEAKQLLDDSIDATKKSEYFVKINDIFQKGMQASLLALGADITEYPQADKIFVVNNKILGFNSDKNSLIDIGLKKEPISKQVLVSEPAARLVYYDGDDNLFIETGMNHLYSYSIKNDKAQQLTAKGDWVQGVNFFKYGTKLYFINNTGSIVKYNSAGANAYSDAFEYITDKSTLISPVSWDVDGKIYVLQKDGSVIQFNQGKKTGFAISGIPLPFDQILNPFKIISPENSSEIYIVDKGQKDAIGPRVLVFDKNGKFQKQYLLPDTISDLSDMVIQPQSKKIWILDNFKAYTSEMK